MSDTAHRNKELISTSDSVNVLSTAVYKSPIKTEIRDKVHDKHIATGSIISCQQQSPIRTTQQNPLYEEEAGGSSASRVQTHVLQNIVGGLETTHSVGSSVADSPSLLSPSQQAIVGSSSGLSTPTHLTYNHQSYKPDLELDTKVRRACERISENVHICANEPSLAFYRLAEHVRKALPPTVESRVQVKRLHQQLLGVYYDAEYGLESVKSIERATPHLDNVCDLLKQALFLQQQIKYENARSKSLMQRTVMPKDASSVTRLKVLL